MTEAYYSQYQTLPPYQRAVFKDGEDIDDGSGRPMWSGDSDPPEVGARVKVTLNGLGAGEVVGYFTEHGWLGLLVALDEKTRPAWHVKQCGTSPGPSHVFGIEFQAEEQR